MSRPNPSCPNCLGTGMVFDRPCIVCSDKPRLFLDESVMQKYTDCLHAGTEGECPSETAFPLTADECKLLYDELRTHTFSRHHPMYHYNSSLLDRMKQFIDNNQDKLVICKP